MSSNDCGGAGTEYAEQVRAWAKDIDTLDQKAFADIMLEVSVTRDYFHAAKGCELVNIRELHK